MEARKLRLDALLVQKGLASTRSQAENMIKLQKVTVNGEVVTKPGRKTDHQAVLGIENSYVSRAAFKLASVSEKFGLNFSEKTVLDVGSSTGGFTDFALRHGARKVVAVDVGTNQMHPSLRTNPKVELHEKTDIREFAKSTKKYKFDYITIDVSFISLKQVLPSVFDLADYNTQIISMMKPQFEATRQQINNGVVKNDTIRRKIAKDFETWVRQYALVLNKADSDVSGKKGNTERFYLLQKSR